MRTSAREFESVSLGRTGDDTSSLFVAVVDHADRVAGVARLIVPAPSAGLSWEIASFTVGPRDRALVAGALWHVVAQALRTNRVRCVASTLDRGSRELLASFGVLLARVSPVSGVLDRQRAAHGEEYRMVTLGAGLHDVQVPRADELLLPASVLAGDLVTFPGLGPGIHHKIDGVRR